MVSDYTGGICGNVIVASWHGSEDVAASHWDGVLGLTWEMQVRVRGGCATVAKCCRPGSACGGKSNARTELTLDFLQG